MSGVMRNSCSSKPVTSTIATSGNCSMRRLITVSANWQRVRKAVSSPASRSVKLRKNTGTSVALAFTTLGRSTSRGRLFIAASIFSFTSMKARSVLVPKSKLKRINPAPSRVSLWISLRPATWVNC